MSATLGERVADALLDDIVQQRYPAGELLPAEPELAITHGVSRLTVREAIRILRTQNVVQIKRGLGTEVNPPETWTSLAAVVRASANDKKQTLAQRLLEARRMIEVGAARLAAMHCTDDHIAELKATVVRMRTAADNGDVLALVDADIQFHDIIMRATGNFFVPLLFDPFGPLLVEARRQTSAIPIIQEHAIEMHRAIIDALRTKDPELARLAMEAHMDQTEHDLHQFVILPRERQESSEDLLRNLAPVWPVAAETIRSALPSSAKVVVLDDDPTGTQTISGVPVLTAWGIDDLRWALRQDAPGLFVLTNTRSLASPEAAERNREVAKAAFEAAVAEGVEIVFASRGDSTLRGHFPLEPDVLVGVVASATHRTVDAVLVVPAYIDAGRLTIDSMHWVRTENGLVQAANSEFAADATFGYSNSYLPAWIEERSLGRVSRNDVERITVTEIREGGPEAVSRRLQGLSGSVFVVVDAVTDDDLRVLAAAVLDAEAAGKSFVYRVGPSFVRARFGQEATAPIRPTTSGTAGGLVVVGSHVPTTSRQLTRLLRQHVAAVVEIDAVRLLDPDQTDEYAAALAEEITLSLAAGLTVVHTSRRLLTGTSRDDSLSISRTLSLAIAAIVQTVVAQVTPGYVIAKGGITSSDIALHGLGINRALVEGTLLPGIVSLWRPLGGPLDGVPYVVFAGNVGDDDALADVVSALSGQS